MSTRGLYEGVWRNKLNDAAWLARDGRGRVETAVGLIRDSLGLAEARIIDVGCGRGTLGRLLGRREGVFGVDISEAAVTEAAKVYEDARRIDLDQDEIPFEPETFDAAVMLDVIEHVLDPRVVVAKVHGALKPGGQLVLSTPNILWWRRLSQMVARRKFPSTANDSYGYDGGHVHYFGFRNLRDIVSDAGFREIRRIGPGAKWLFSDFRGAAVWLGAVK